MKFKRFSITPYARWYFNTSFCTSSRLAQTHETIPGMAASRHEGKETVLTGNPFVKSDCAASAKLYGQWFAQALN